MISIMKKREVISLNQKIAKIVSTVVLEVAKKSSSTVCNWITYQPKVPLKLIDKN